MTESKLTPEETSYLIFLYFDVRQKLDVATEPAMKQWYDCELAAIRNFLEQGYLDIASKVGGLASTFYRRATEQEKPPVSTAGAD